MDNWIRTYISSWKDMWLDATMCLFSIFLSVVHVLSSVIVSTLITSKSKSQTKRPGNPPQTIQKKHNLRSHFHLHGESHCSLTAYSPPASGWSNQSTTSIRSVIFINSLQVCVECFPWTGWLNITSAWTEKLAFHSKKKHCLLALVAILWLWVFRKWHNLWFLLSSNKSKQRIIRLLHMNKFINK